MGYIQHEYGDIALANAVYRTFHSDRFKFIVDNRFTSHASCVNDLKRDVIVNDAYIHRITRRAGSVINNHPFFTQEVIDKRGFSDIRSTDNRNFYCCRCVVDCFISFREDFYDPVKQFSNPIVLDTGGPHRFFQTKPIKLGGFIAKLLGVYFVDDEANRFASGSEFVSDD